jgi:hypothetical protein
VANHGETVVPTMRTEFPPHNYSRQTLPDIQRPCTAFMTAAAVIQLQPQYTLYGHMEKKLRLETASVSKCAGELELLARRY